MAVLPSQRLKTSRYRSRFDPIYRDSYLLLGVVTVIFGLATAIMEWSRFGELAFGLTLLSLFGFYFLELFREQAPHTIAYIISCFSVLGIIGPIQQFSSTIWTLFVADRGDVCKYYLPLTDRICNDFRFRQETARQLRRPGLRPSSVNTPHQLLCAGVSKQSRLIEAALGKVHMRIISRRLTCSWSRSHVLAWTHLQPLRLATPSLIGCKAPLNMVLGG